MTVAMVGARTLAMGLNRLIDAEVDARNPRTAMRELPAGTLSPRPGRRGCARWRSPSSSSPSSSSTRSCAGSGPFRWRSSSVYPYLKRVTWLCHLWLGASLGLAPVGAWAAMTGELPWQAWALGGAVALWVAGFDFFYSLFDLEHDRARGAALVGDALRRAAASFSRRAAVSPRHRRAARCCRARARGRSPVLARRRRPLPPCSPTSTRSYGRVTCAASTRRSSRSTA